jgi:anti-sigma regulatory factor (Ser/Thr protein kinase)
MSCEQVLATGTPVEPGVPHTSAHLDLLPEPGAAKRARDFVSEQAPALTPATWTALRLLTSELVTNAVVHARTAMQVGLTVTDSKVLVTVGDHSSALPERRSEADDRPGGRGLVLLDRLADEWGVHVNDGGKTLWFTLPRPRAQPNGGEARL